ncbi:LysR substrate-binding domain-containing protein [Paracoccus sp. p4-l81]|uniref:hydrogen peroxide-inducible genes activator n=1 Tax=unclassified Paracoccus (in: a-proteobacteria) TaxID=2688777 RepID=UPI0035BB3180
MTQITLRQLRYVVALARHGHFGRAAQDCAVTQPALSTQIREIETTLGGPLFDRNARQVTPTALGEQVIARARAVLRQVDDITDLGRIGTSGHLHRLRMGVIPTVAPYLLPQVMADLAAAFPDLDMTVRETVTPNLLADLAEGRLDTAIIALPASEPALEEVELFTESFVLIRPLTEAGGPIPSPRNLRQMRLLLLEEGHCFRDQALSFCQMQPDSPREMLDGSSLTTLVQMVAAGMGVTLIPDMAVPVETRLARVDVGRFPAPEPARRIGMVWRRGSPLRDGLMRVADHVGRAARRGDGAQPHP